MTEWDFLGFFLAILFALIVKDFIDFTLFYAGDEDL